MTYYCIISPGLQNGLKNKYYSINSKRNTLFQLCDYVFCDNPNPHFIIHPENKIELDKKDNNLYTIVILGSVQWKGLAEELINP